MSDLRQDIVVKNKETFRLIFHIGAGKTGTSSIQASLNQGREKLQACGYDYWGLMLETAPITPYEWQRASASKLFLELDSKVAEHQLADVLEQSIAIAKSQGFRGAIWSNEWFFGRHHNVIPALKTIEKQGVGVEIVVYVRRHDAWAKSAYVQWGLKHKTYGGPLMPFKEYVRKRPVRFASTLQPWADAFSRTFVLRNFDTAGDAVNDFVTTLALPGSILSQRVNEAPTAEELLLRALYNKTVKGDALPNDFDKAFAAKQIDFGLVPKAWLDSLLPTTEDLEDIIESSTKDRLLLDEMLVKAGQPIISTEPLTSKPVTLDQEKLTSILFQIIVQQTKKLQRLQREVRLLAQVIGPEEVHK